MLAAAQSAWFRCKVRAWCWLCWRGGFNFDTFTLSLDKAEFREFRDKREAKRSIGWSGQNPDCLAPQWLFGVCASVRRTWLLGRSIIDHELFHAAQDHQSEGELFRPSVRLRWWQEVGIELQAHLFGGPLIGVPWLLLLLLCLFVIVWMIWVVLRALLVFL
jgi:hypothetical protein